MQKKLSAFFAQIGAEKKGQYLEKALSFLSDENRKILYREGELFFLNNGLIESSFPLKGKASHVIEFDGTAMSLIDPSYYLGDSKNKKKIESGYFDSGGSFHSNNNNNNNNNNGNNNG